MLWLEGILPVAMAAVLGVETLLPVFAGQSWHSGSAGYGLLRIAPGVGAVLAGLGVSMFPPTGRRILVLSVAFAGAGAALTAFAAWPRPAVPASAVPGRPLRVQPGWQDGHQKVTRSSCPAERTGVPHRRHGLPRRP